MLSFGPDAMHFYLDDASVSTHPHRGGLDAAIDASGTPVVGNQEPVVLGANSWASNPLSAYPLTSNGFFDGLLDGLEILQFQLTDAEVQARYDSQVMQATGTLQR